MLYLLRKIIPTPMKKQLILFVLLCTNFIYSQDYTNVLNLLIDNKRDEARKLFDKQFDKTKTANIDLLFLDAFIDEESGKIDFDETLIKNLEKLPNSENFIAPFINRSLILTDVSKGICNDLTYKKIDFLASSPKFKNLAIIKYRKAIFERIRLRHEESLKSFNALGAIDQWQFCGVFENLNSSGLDIEYEPELYAKNDKLFDANSNGKIGWYNPKEAQAEGYYFFANESEYGNGIIYAQTFIQANEKKDYILSFGANSGLKIFLNDKEIYVNPDIKRTNLDAYSIKIVLEKGNNRLLFKLELENGGDYFSAQIKNSDATNATDLKFINTFQPYSVSLSEGSNTEEIKLNYEQYFDDLVKKFPENILYRLFQFTAYESNCKKTEAFEAIEGLDKKYPNSSFIASYFLRYYNLLGDEVQKRQEILKNIENNDIDYYLSTLNKLTDKDWLTNTSILEIEKFRDRSKQYKQKYCELMFDFILASRKADIDGMFKSLNDLNDNSYNNEKIKILTASLYFKLKNDKIKSISLLEEISKEKFINEVDNLLISYYNDLNKKEEIKKIVTDRITNFPYLNTFRNAYITILTNENQYDKALELIDENLSYFPYSFSDLEKKGNIYSLLKKDKEAEKYIRLSLGHNSGNGELRKQLYDITKTPDEIEEVATKNIYKLANERKNSKLKSDYGVVTLLDEYIVNILPEGGRKAKCTLLYEITSESGIEEMKEYSLDLDNTILKSEIIKSDGSLVPAEKGDDTLVFSNLKVGDVIYIQYESHENPTGRFYKDFNIACYFDSKYPSTEAIFALIHEANVNYITDYSNGTILSTTKKAGNKIYTIWKRNNIPAISLLESYSPDFNDLTNIVRVGTVKSWKEISNWYADLVKKSLKTDKITKTVFDQIFPNGFQSFSQEEIAKKIYAYIETNINYSSLDFRQSGYVPQKPSKTITTKLGDCKDVSTLFVALAQYAGLKSNLVLVLTNDNDSNSMRLPSKDFNHCIVKTNIDNKDIFLELTDKFLPFRALPISLYKANALVISFDKTINENASLINIPFDNAIQNVTKTNSIVTIDEKSKSFINTHTVQGSNKAYYNEIFAASTTDDVRKNEFEKDFNKRLKKVVSLQSVKLLSNDFFEKGITFETKFSISESLQKVGSLKITEIPFIDNAYTRDIISTETRKFDIKYIDYENNNQYESEVILNIPADKSFSEIPENKTLNFKNHKYSITYDLINKNSLKVIRKVSIPWDNIATTEYLEYKKFVESVIEAEEQIVGFK